MHLYNYPQACEDNNEYILTACQEGSDQCEGFVPSGEVSKACSDILEWYSNF